MEGDKLTRWLEESYGTSNSTEPELEKVIAVIDDLAIDPIDEEATYDAIFKKINTPQLKRKTIYLKWVAGIAAALVGTLVAVTLFFNTANVETGFGDQMAYVLPEQSRVTLNSNSHISYDNNFSIDRTLELEGEAFFEVTKGSTFTVKTTVGSVEVLGTSFNVVARDGTFSVSCKTGKVKVSNARKSVILTPGERARLVKNVLIKENTSVDHIGAWTQGESQFDSEPLKNVLLALSHQYDIAIPQMSANSLNQKYTGSFVHNDLNKALDMVFLPMSIQYTITDDGQLMLQ